MVDGLSIELAPLTKESVRSIIDPVESNHGMNRHSVNQYLAHGLSFTIEDEEGWYDKTRADTDSVVWGIWLREGETRTLIGVSGLTHLKRDHIRQATSGSQLFRKEYWGRGIASATHKARTWYAFTQLGLHRIMSAVIQGNEGSLKALQRSGYTKVYVERNTHFTNGRLHHQDNIECLNPLDPFWSQWWGADRPSKASVAARQQTLEVLAWAEENVELL